MLDWSKGATYENVVATVRSVLGQDYPIHKKGDVYVKPEGFVVYDALSNVRLPSLCLSIHLSFPLTCD